MKINVMLVSKMENTLTSMRNMIQDDEIAVVFESPSGAIALDNIENISPDIVIMSLTSGDMDVLNLAERVIQHKPRTFVVFLTETLDVETLQTVMKIGAHNVTEFPEDPKKFADYIKGVYNAETVKLNAMNESQAIAWSSKVITVFASKGGLGKTTIATNLSIQLADKGKKVALIDLNLQFGDVHIFMDIEPKDTIAELVQEVYTPNIDSLRSYMVMHPSGVHVLCAPKSPEYAEVVSPERIQSILSLMRSYYDYIIIDTPSILNDITITAIEAASMVLFIAGLDISILKNSKLSMSLLESLQQKEKVKIVINRAVEMNTITIDDVKRVTECPIFAKIPSDYLVAVSALNRGVPFVLGSPKSKLSMAISDVARVIENGEEDYDFQKLTPKERKKVLKKYKTEKRSLKFGMKRRLKE